MNIWQRMTAAPGRRPSTEQRRNLRIIVVEGIPATIIANLLGGPILTAYLLYLGASSAEVGLVMALPPLANLVQIMVAYYMQRFDNRRLLLFYFGSSHRLLWVATGFIPFVVADSYQIGVFIVLYALSFIMASSSGVFWSSLVADIVPSLVRGRYFGIRNMILWAAASLSLIIGGQILESMKEGTGFVVLYAISAVCMVWNAVELWRYPNPPFQKSGETGKAGLFLKPLRDRAYIKATLFISLFILIQNIVVPLFSYVMLDVMKISYMQVTAITSVQMIVMMISYYYWGNLNARFATKTLMLWCLPIIGAACVLWAGLELLPALLVLTLVHILLGIGLGGYNLLAFNFMIGDTPKADRPMYVAMFSALTGITGFIGPLIGGMIYKKLETWPLWVASYGVSTAAGVLLLVLALLLGPVILKAPRRNADAMEGQQPLG
ncbi:MFS transporter [Paenibacillus sp. SYP-B4298]|uniref:MFS transporter n=1 Tax=Paenibacillus sp. SYP-B4298 TaxID=2996034 RepID=UPI0022DE4045|nr:MFS transporter [Paenibacillus sp. SYP-B4298]